MQILTKKYMMRIFVNKDNSDGHNRVTGKLWKMRGGGQSLPATLISKSIKIFGEIWILENIEE